MQNLKNPFVFGRKTCTFGRLGGAVPKIVSKKKKETSELSSALYKSVLLKY